MYFDEYEPEELEKIINNQQRLIEHMKKKNVKRLHSILFVVDDFADSPSFNRHSQLLHSLYTRGRHSMISTITATQEIHALHPIVRVNTESLYIYRFRNNKDLEAFIEEVSASVDRKTLMNIYIYGRGLH